MFVEILPVFLPVELYQGGTFLRGVRRQACLFLAQVRHQLFFDLSLQILFYVGFLFHGAADFQVFILAAAPAPGDPNLAVRHRFLPVGAIHLPAAQAPLFRDLVHVYHAPF